MPKMRVARRGRDNPEFHDEDNNLVARYLRGEEQAFNLLYQKYRMKLLHFVNNKIHDSDRSEDLVQEVFMRVWRHLRSYDPKRKFSTWIYTIASRMCLNEIRNQKRGIVTLFQQFSGEELSDREIDFEDPRQDPENAIREREARLVLGFCIEQLPERRRRIFELRRLEGRTIAETAVIMVCPQDTVKSNVNRAESEITRLARKLIRRKRT